MEYISDLFANEYFLIIPAFLFVLTIVVFFHELGHFLAARWCGVTVEVFSVGFGPEIFGFYDRKGTRWKVSWIPLGGYVKFIDDLNAASIPDAEALNSLTPEQKAGALQFKPLWQRAVVVAAGPLASFLLAIVVFTATFTIYGYGYIKPVVGGFSKDSAALEAGFKVGDEITSINGSPVKSFMDIKAVVQISGNEKLNFDVLRNGKTIQLISSPRDVEERDAFGNKQRLLGIRSSSNPDDRVYYRVDPFTAVYLSLDRTYAVITTTTSYLYRVISGRVSADQLSGPIGIAVTSGKVATFGIIPLIQLAAFLSIAIGFFNLFPIPILDGGHLAFYAIEAVRGKPLSPKTQDIAAHLGFALLILLMIFVTRLDFIHRIPWG